jgi:hypothetical protein
MIWLIRGYWRDAIMVCRASGNYGTPFKAGRDVTQGGPLSAKLFNTWLMLSHASGSGSCGKEETTRSGNWPN